MVKRMVVGFVSVVGALVLSVPSAHATVYDLTTAGSSSTDTLALFNQTSFSSTGTGLIDSFVRVQQPGGGSVEEGYNTTVNGVFNNGSDDTHNHQLLLSAVPTLSLSGTDSREFLLDIFESGGGNSLLSLDEIQVFLSQDPNQSVTSFTGDGLVDLANSALVYRLDSDKDGAGTASEANNWVKLNADLNNGSGSGDMFLYIPNSLFATQLALHPTYTYVYLYSHLGGQGNGLGSSSTFEEWAVRICGTGVECVQPPPPPPPVIPEPTSLLLLGTGLLGTVFRGSRKRLF